MSLSAERDFAHNPHAVIDEIALDTAFRIINRCVNSEGNALEERIRLRREMANRIIVDYAEALGLKRVVVSISR